MTNMTCTDIDDAEDNAKMVGHLKADDFFGVETHPTANFVITSSKKDEENEGYYTITGDLTIKGVTNPIEFPAFVANEEGKIKIEATFAFDRTDFGIEYGSKSIIGKLAGKFIYDEIELNINGKY